jgi:hypothetical protein
MRSNELGHLKWCCDAFALHVATAGLRGIGIIAKQIPGMIVFEMQYRTLNVGEIIPPDLPHPLALVAASPLVFCPWCGRQLVSFYDEESRRQMLRSDLILPFP